jgi:hypothetical protein
VKLLMRLMRTLFELLASEKTTQQPINVYRSPVISRSRTMRKVHPTKPQERIDDIRTRVRNDRSARDRQGGDGSSQPGDIGDDRVATTRPGGIPTTEARHQHND